MQIQFTCTVCDTRTTRNFSKHSYEKGVVIVICDGCDNKHLIADNLGWFAETGGKVNIEDLMARKGEEVRKTGVLDFGPDAVGR
jgi:protein import protein ZIM17